MSTGLHVAHLRARRGGKCAVLRRYWRRELSVNAAWTACATLSYIARMRWFSTTLCHRPVECRWLVDKLVSDWMKKEHRDAVRICIDTGRFRWRAKRRPEAKGSRKCRKRRTRRAQLGGKFTMQAPAHLQPKVVKSPPSRKRSCPEPDDIVASAAESSDSSWLVPGSLFTPLADDVGDAGRHVSKTFFSWKLCFCTRTRLPNNVSENGETLCFFDLQITIVSAANATLSRPRTKTRGYIPTSRWKAGNGALGRFGRAGFS